MIDSLAECCLGSTRQSALNINIFRNWKATNGKGHIYIYIYICIKIKYSLYRPGVAQSLGRGIALLFHDRGTWRGWVVSSTPWPHYIPGIDPVPILQEAGWAPGPVWTGGNSRPHRDSIPDRPARSSVAIPTELPGPHTHTHTHTHTQTYIYIYIYIYIYNSTKLKYFC